MAEILPLSASLSTFEDETQLEQYNVLHETFEKSLMFESVENSCEICLCDHEAAALCPSPWLCLPGLVLSR